MEKQTENLKFGDVIALLEKGAHLSRKAWDPGRYIEYYSNGTGKNAQFGTPTLYGPCIMIWLSRRRRCIYTPPCEDLFADDWFVVE